MEINIQKISEKFQSITYDYSELINTRDFNSNYGFRDLPVVYKKTFGDNQKSEKIEKFLTVFNCWFSEENEPSKNQNNEIFEKEGVVSDLSIDNFNMGKWCYLVSGKKFWFIYPSTFNSEINNNLSNYKFDIIETINEKNYTNLIKPFFAIQEPGDLIYIPGINYSIQINLEDSIFYEERFMNEINYDRVRFALKKKNIKTYQHSEKIIKKNFEKIKNKM